MHSTVAVTTSIADSMNRYSQRMRSRYQPHAVLVNTTSRKSVHLSSESNSIFTRQTIEQVLDRQMHRNSPPVFQSFPKSIIDLQ